MTNSLFFLINNLWPQSEQYVKIKKFLNSLIKSSKFNIISLTSLQTGHLPLISSGFNKNKVLQFQHIISLFFQLY
jgi:hypothetical protein